MAATITPWISAFSSIGFLNSGVRDDDLTDRLNHGAMSTILLCLALTTCIKEYVGEPIACWIPTEYKAKKYRDYVHSYCWIHQLYSLPMEDSIPINESERYTNDLRFYRWVTIFFILQAGMFQIPRLAWNGMKSLSGLQMDAVISMALETSIMSAKKRDEKLRFLAEFFHRWIVCRSGRERTGKFKNVRNFLFNSFLFCSGQSGKQTISMYLLVKILYLANVIVQFFLVSTFLDVNYWDFGVSATRAYFSDGMWEDEYNFPRVAMCDFQIRQLTNVQTFSVQCVLAMNLFLEKMFLALWFCFLFLIVANSISLFRWIVNMLNSSGSTEDFVHYIDAIVPWHQCSPEMFHDFICSYLRPDGVFVIKMVAVNTSDMHAAEIVQHLWVRYKQFRKDSEE